MVDILNQDNVNSRLSPFSAIEMRTYPTVEQVCYVSSSFSFRLPNCIIIIILVKLYQVTDHHYFDD